MYPVFQYILIVYVSSFSYNRGYFACKSGRTIVCITLSDINNKLRTVYSSCSSPFTISISRYFEIVNSFSGISVCVLIFCLSLKRKYIVFIVHITYSIKYSVVYIYKVTDMLRWSTASSASVSIAKRKLSVSFIKTSNKMSASLHVNDLLLLFDVEKTLVQVPRANFQEYPTDRSRVVGCGCASGRGRRRGGGVDVRLD